MSKTLPQLIESCLRKFSLPAMKEIFLNKGLTLNQATSFMSSMRNTDRLSTEVYNYYLTFLARKGYNQGVREGIRECEEEALDSLNHWVNIHLQLHAANLELDSSLSLLSSLSSSSYTPFDASYSSFYSASPSSPPKYGLEVVDPEALAFCVEKLGRDTSTLDYFQRIWNKMSQKLDDMVFVVERAMMKQYAKLGKLEKVFEIMEMIKEEGGQLEPTDFNAILRICMENKREKEGYEVVERMKKENFKPSGITYAILIRFAAKQNNIAKVNELVTTMKKQKVPMNAVIYTILINVSLQERGGLEGAQVWIEDMEKRGINPPEEIFRMIVEKGIERKMETKVFTYALENMRQRKMEVTKKDYHEWIEMAVRYDNEEAGKWLLPKMRDESWEPTRLLFFNLMDLAVKKGDEDGVTLIAQNMADAGIILSSKEFAKYMNDAINNNNNNNSEERKKKREVEEEDEDEIEVRERLNVLLRDLLRSEKLTQHGLIADALERWKEKKGEEEYVANLSKKAFEPLMKSTLASIIRKVMKEGEGEIGRWMNALRISPDLPTGIALLRVAAKKGNLEEIKFWIKEIGVEKMNPIHVQVVVEGLEKRGEKEKIKEVVEALRKEEKPVINNIIDRLVQSKKINLQ